MQPFGPKPWATMCQAALAPPHTPTHAHTHTHVGVHHRRGENAGRVSQHRPQPFGPSDPNETPFAEKIWPHTAVRFCQRATARQSGLERSNADTLSASLLTRLLKWEKPFAEKIWPHTTI